MAQFPPVTKLTKQLLMGMVGLWVAELILQNFLGVPVAPWLELTLPPGVHTLWQPFSFVFTRPLEPRHVLGVLVGFVFFAWMVSDFQRMYGKRRTLQLLAVSAVAAAIPAIVVGAIEGHVMSITGSGITVTATIVCFAWSRRHGGSINLFGMVRLEPMHLIGLVLFIDFVMFLANPVFAQLAASLGAVGGSIAFAEWMSRPPSRRGGIRRKKKSKRSSKTNPLRGIRGGKADDKPRWLN